MRRFVRGFLATWVVWAVSCSDGASTGPDVDEEIPEAVRAFVEEAIADLETESREVWLHRETVFDEDVAIDSLGSALALLGSEAVYDATVVDPRASSLASATTTCFGSRGHRLWQVYERCRVVGGDPSEYSALLFIQPRLQGPDTPERLRYTGDDGEVLIVYRENPKTRWDVVRRPSLTASTSVMRDVRVEIDEETFDLRHHGVIEIDGAGGATTFDLWFPGPRLSVDLRVDFESDLAASGTITRGSVIVTEIGGLSGDLTFTW